MRPLVSIVLCTYDRQEYLDRSISSVVSQDFTDWELLVVDDGSQDRTFDVVNRFLCSSTRILFLKQHHQGQAAAKNLGIHASSGEFLTFLDSDDAYQPEHIQTRVDFMRLHPEVDLIQGGVSTAGEVLVPDYYRPGTMIPLSQCVLGPTFFGRRQVFLDLGGFRLLSYGEDTDLWERAARRFRTAHLQEPKTYSYTRAATSITKSAEERL